MVIRDEQIKTIERLQIEKFINDSEREIKKKHLALLEKSGINDPRAVITEVIYLCGENMITIENNIFNLVLCKIEFGFAIPLHQNLKKILGTENTGENIRVEKFINCVLSGRHHLVNVNLHKQFE